MQSEKGNKSGSSAKKGMQAPRLGETQPATSFSQATPTKKRKKIFIGAAAIAVLILGSTAGAYFGMYVPNKPENVLRTALKNTAQQTKAKYNGSLAVESTDEQNSYAANIKLDGQLNSEAGNFQGIFDVTVSGVKVPAEIRKVDKNLYIKFGDLSTIKSLAGSVPEYTQVIDELTTKLSDQWIEVDETLLKQAKADCAIDAVSSLKLTEQDLTTLENRYNEVQFTTINSTADDKVNGKDAIKYELEIDDNKLAEYAKGLNELSAVKKLKECDATKDQLNDEKLADNDKTPLTVWVDKDSKVISKIAGQTTKKDEEKTKTKANLELTLVYGQANIEKPQDAKPLLEVVGDLKPLFEGLAGQALGGDAASE